MDIIKKITILLWALAAILVTPPLLRSFGLKPKDLVKSFLSDLHTPDQPAIKTPILPVEEELFEVPHTSSSISDPEEEDLSPAEEAESSQEQENFEDMILGLEQISAVAPESELELLPAQVYRPENSAQKVRFIPPPPGFSTADTFNYLIYREKNPVTEKIKTLLDNIHGNLMLDLTPFTILIKPNKILVMLFGEKETYMDFTKRPSWSGASSDLRADTMYVIEGKSFYALSVHELTHLYFDGYFLPTISPLWLSEGMAVYMQIHATKQKPSWVDRSMRQIIQGKIIPLEQMTVTEDLSALSTQQAELWYTQAYSLMDYLLNKRTRDEFYKFCNELKAKVPLHQALYRAYGMPFTKISVLENVWLHEIQREYRSRAAQKTSAAANPPAGKQPPATAKPPAKTKPKPIPQKKAKPQPQKTKINTLQRVPLDTYKGGF